MALAYDAVIATIVVASDATSVTKEMVGTTWRQGTSGEWSDSDCTLEAGKTYQFRTGLSEMFYPFYFEASILPNIKASVTIDWDVSGTEVDEVPDYFMAGYALGCDGSQIPVRIKATCAYL